MKHEPRQIIEYHNVTYQPKAHILDVETTPLECYNNAFNFVLNDDSFIYVEGYVWLKPNNLKMGRAWVVEKENTKRAYELCQLPINGLKNGETIPWDIVEYHGYEITKDEMLKAERPPVLTVADLTPILEKIKRPG